jgi:predicted HicB family RNase H-like nuclease
MASDARLKSIKKYADVHYDMMSFRLPKGAKEQLKSCAAAAGVSVSRYILEAVEQRSGLKLTLDNALPWISTSETKK